MADGFSRFTMSTLQHNGPCIDSSLPNASSHAHKTFQGLPHSSFLPQSNVSTMNQLRQFPRVYHDNYSRYPPLLPQNQMRLLQSPQASATNVVDIQRHHFAGEDINNDRSTNSSPNSFHFSVPLGSQYSTKNTNMDVSLTQLTNIPPCFSAGAAISQNNFFQPVAGVPSHQETSSLSTLPGLFSGGLQGALSLPSLAPIPFSPPISCPPQISPLAPPQEFQQLGAQCAVQQKELTSQDWVDIFLSERKIEREEKQAARRCGLKINEAKECLSSWLQLISELSLQRDKLAELASRNDESEWRQELEKAQILKVRISKIQAQFSSPEEMKQLEEQVAKRKRKREWQKRKRKEEYMLKIEAEERKTLLNKKIDQWRGKIVAEHEAKRRAESVKSEAGGVLGEVKRKQADATRAVELLKALTKLRDARKFEAEMKGVYRKPTEEDNRRFRERVSWLEDMMVRRRELYEAEEKTLKVMLAEEEEEKEKERREKERKNQASLGLSDPMDWFRSYYNQAERNLQSLLHIRQQWDTFLVPETVPGASRIPDGFVTPVEPWSDLWATALIDKG